MSSHRHDTYEPIPDFRLGPKAASVERIAAIIGGLGLILCVPGYIMNHAQFFQSYLFAFLYWSGFTLGGLCLLLLSGTVGGVWGVTARRFFEAKMRTLPLVLIFLIPVLVLGLRYLYPWTHADLVSHSGYLKARQHYLNVPFFIARVVLYFAIWLFWGLRLSNMFDRQDATGDPTLRERIRAFSAPGLLIFVMSATFAYIDWILSADAQYYSTVYGALIIIGDVLQTFALTIIVMILASRGDRFGGRINYSVLHDLGNLMFAFTIFWTYLTASQLIITWPANLPQELQWYLDRVHGPWKWITVFIALTMFAIPFLALLSQARKRDPRRLIKMAIWLLLARIVDIFWFLAPTYRNVSPSALLATSRGFSIYWTDFAAFLGLGGIWIYVYLRQLRRRPLLPLRDGRVSAPMPEVLA
ncbi:MAG TPA: hypothetical protein VH302_06925 [Bryobacteraceae bacterium]|nr:hypothetical protein [Bryobacteraceae bacterium]